MEYKLSNSMIPAQCVQVILLHFIALSVFMLHVDLQYLSIAHIKQTAPGVQVGHQLFPGKQGVQVI